jgi:hypothetical protein
MKLSGKYILSLIFFIFLVGITPLEAQWYYFGRNKVQYTDFDWQVLRTDHFDIYYYPEMEELAEHGAHFAEQSFHYLENKFNFSMNRRIPLIFYSSHLHFQQTNVTPSFIPEGVGGFFEFLKGRVVIPSNGNINQFRKVIFHELVHVFMHSKVYYVNKEHARFEGTYPPLWFVEGLAEYWSSEWDAQAEMVMRDAVLNNYVVPLSQIYQIMGTYMMYKEGQAILQFIAETYGEEAILQFMEEIWKYSKFSDVFRDVTGKAYEEFDQEWLYSLKKKYYPLLKANDFSKMVAYTIVNRGYNFKPAYFKDKNNVENVVFIGNRGGYSNIFLKKIQPVRRDQRGKSKILIKGERTSDFESFHLFSSKLDVDQQGNLIFSSKSGENDALYIFNIPEDRIYKKFQWPELVSILSPSFSRNGSKIVFSAVDFSGKQDIYILDIRRETLLRLTDDYYEDRDPTFSPDGQKVVFSSDRTQFGKEWCYNLFVYNLDTGLIHYLTTGHHQDNSPVWSPNGQFIAFTSDRDTSLNIWMVDLSMVSEWDATVYQKVKLKQISKFINAAFDPEWVDNDRLLFSVYENNRFEIRLMDQIARRIDSTKVLAQNPILNGHRKWEFNTLAGNKVRSKFKYQKKYNLDIAQAQVSQDPFWGTTGGAIFAFTDVLGNDQYYFTLYNNAQSQGDFFKSFNGAITKVSLQKRTNYAYGFFRFSGRYFNYRDGYYYEDRVGGFFTISYPFSQFNRLEYNTNLSYSDKEVFGSRQRHSILTSNSISIVSDNSIWWYTGPMEGHRYNITIANTYDLRWSNVNYYTFLADLRQYIRIAPKLTHAIRFLILYNEGQEARWFYLGGSWDLRGYRRWSIQGEKIALISNELRFPFIEYLGIKFPTFGLGFRAINGALFIDAGNAWNEEFRGLLGSMGFGFRMNFAGALVLRIDFGKRTDFRKFTSDWFTQFFFGWDF